MVFTPLVSIIVPVYNVEKYLSKCIDSILAQIYQNIELILVDDGSSDRSSEICDFYVDKDTRVKCIHKKNGGVSSARNVGIENALGDYIAFVDSDDWVEDSYLNELIPFLEGKDMLFFGARVCDSKGKLLNIMKLKNLDSISSSYNDILNYLLGTDVFGHTCMMLICREFVFLNNIRFYENVTIHEDFIFTCECLLKTHSITTRDDTPYIYVQYMAKRQTLSSVLPENYETIALKRLSVFNQLVSKTGINGDQKILIRKIREFSYLGSIDVIVRSQMSLRDKIEKLKNMHKLFEITSPISVLKEKGFNQKILQYVINTNSPYIILLVKWLVSKIK